MVLRLLARQDHRLHAVAVALVGQVARELRDEQAAVRQDEDAERSGGFDEAAGGDRLPRSGRVAEAEAADCARVAHEVDDLGLALRGHVLVFVLVGLGGRVGVAVAVPVRAQLLVLALVRRDQLGQHPRERVHLMAAQLRAGREAGRSLAQDALEPQHEAEADLPLRRRLVAAGLDLSERLVESAASRRPGRQHGRRILLGVEERLAGPRFGAGSGFGEGVRCLRRCGRILGRVSPCARRFLRRNL